MKANLHPTYHQTAIKCGCGNTFTLGSVLPTLQVDICSKCHPFYTGEQRFVDTLGKVDKFMAKRQAAIASPVAKKSKNQKKDNSQHKSLKDMLSGVKVAE